jgi:hypothetical protein
MSALLNLGDKITAGNRADATFFYKKRVADDSGTLLTEAETDANNRELLAQSLFDKASIVYTAGGVKASKAYSVKGTDFTVTRAGLVDGIKRVIGRDGVLTEIPANTPATEFSNGVLKGTLIEPARTNLLQRSEEFDNGYWTKDNLNITGTPPYVNVAIAPDGTLTAEKIIADATNTAHNFNVLQNITINLPYFFSAFLKRDEYQYGYIRGLTAGGNFGTAIFDLENGTVLSAGSADEAGIIDLANGWYRCYVKFTATATTTVRLRFGVSDNDTSMIFEGDGTSGIFIWGAQLETGSDATSYIRTTDTAITQPADVITATGVSGEIGQTEGTVLLEVDLRAGKSNTARIITVADNNFVNGFILNQRTQNDFEVIFRVNDVNLSTRIFSGNIVTGKYRIGIKYQLGESFNLFVNGSKLADGNVFSGFSSPLDRFYLGTRQQGDVQFNDTTPQALIFKQALTDQEIQTWTTL